MNKEKIPKSDRNRRLQPNVNRAPARPPPQPPNSDQTSERPPSASTSIFGSLRRLKAGINTSTPKKPATFYADLEKKDDRNRALGGKAPKNKVKKGGTVISADQTVIRRIDNNGNFTSGPSSVVDGVTLRADARRVGEDAKSAKHVVDAGKRPEARRVISSRAAGLSRDKAKNSTISLQNLIRNQPRTIQSQTAKPKRPVTVAVSNISVRRGHKEGQGHQDNLSRTSSITNLDSLESSLQSQPGKGAKPRKAASKERIDKQIQDGKKVTKNNNKLEPPLPPTGQPLSYSSDSLQEAELQQLRKQLRDMADEKSSLALQLGEQRGQLNVLQKEILKLKSFQDESNLEMEKLAEENTALRNRLRDVAHSPLSDNEKQQLLFESRHHSSAPASIATNVAEDNGGDTTTCTTPDWDKHSSGNVSEVSVACLQDKINQMQETHYSTNEELQATLQELTDLQRQLTELQQENERLNEEKTLMFDSLCRQTERLNDSRQEVENLKQLLYRDRSDETGINQLESAVEREQKLVELLRSAQEEREQLLLKLEQVQAELHDSRTGNADKTDTITQLTERVRTLESTLDAKHAEHKQLDQELAQAKDQCSGKQIEIDRLSDLLENARTKISELEQDRALSDKSELDELLDNARKEKDQLESEVTYLKEQLARSKNEIEKLKEQVFMLQEECKVTRNNAKSTQADLEYKCEKLVAEKNTLGEQLQQFQEVVNELQVQAQCHLEDKRQLSAVLSETQRNMSEVERKNLNLENEIQELRKLRAEENDEWEKFQNDLLTSVRVANDFKTEAQQELQKIILENKTYREKVRLLEGQVEKLKGEKTSTSTQTDIILTPQIITLARNLDPSLPNRISLLEHSYLRSHDPGSPSSPTGSMEKLFPILSRDRRSKSRDNLTDIASSKGSQVSSKRRRSHEGSVKSRTRTNLSSQDEQIKKNETDFKRSKSRDDLKQYAGDSHVHKPKEENRHVIKGEKSISKLQNQSEIDSNSKGFLFWNTNKANVEHKKNETTSSPQEKKSFLRRNKSDDKLDKRDESTSSSKQKKVFFKRNKSQDNLDQIGTTNTEELVPSPKQKKTLLKRTRSQDNLEVAVVTSHQSNLDDDSAKQDTKQLDKPRKSKDSIESSSESNKSDTKPEFFSKFKKRDKKPTNRSKLTAHPKFISVEEGILLKSLDNWYDNIDKNLPDEFLSEEDRAVKKLKILYEDDMLKERPVAHKPKEHLAISKPLLNSVVLNPKLERIFTDPNFQTVDPEVRRSALEDVCSLIEIKDDTNETSAPRYRMKSEEVYTNIGPPGIGIHKSRSLEDINVFEEYRTDSELAPVLYRTVETDNLTTDEHIAIKSVPYNRMSSDIHPNDSVSNPRYSSKYYIHNDLPKPNIYINYENLDEIVDKIPRDAPEYKLTEEQKFALKLKEALDDAEKKTTLKKMKKKKGSIKGLEISAPTRDSVEKNWKLKEIILNPRIKPAAQPIRIKKLEVNEWKRHSTDISSDLGSPHEITKREGIIKPSSKSYEDISFSFVPENTLLNLYYGEKIRGSKFTSDSSSSSHSFTSAEFNLDTGRIVQKYDIPVEFQKAQDPEVQVDQKEDLLYNETMNKMKNKSNKEKRYSQEDITKLKVELSNQGDDEHMHHPKIQDALEKYEHNLKETLKRIEMDEVRKSLKKPKFQVSETEIKYQIAQSQELGKESHLIVQKHEDITKGDTFKEFEDKAQDKNIVRLQSPIEKESFQVATLEGNRLNLNIKEVSDREPTTSSERNSFVLVSKHELDSVATDSEQFFVSQRMLPENTNFKSLTTYSLHEEKNTETERKPERFPRNEEGGTKLLVMEVRGSITATNTVELINEPEKDTRFKIKTVPALTTNPEVSHREPITSSARNSFVLISKHELDSVATDTEQSSVSQMMLPENRSFKSFNTCSLHEEKNTETERKHERFPRNEEGNSKLLVMEARGSITADDTVKLINESESPEEDTRFKTKAIPALTTNSEVNDREPTTSSERNGFLLISKHELESVAPDTEQSSVSQKMLSENRSFKSFTTYSVNTETERKHEKFPRNEEGDTKLLVMEARGSITADDAVELINESVTPEEETKAFLANAIGNRYSYHEGNNTSSIVNDKPIDENVTENIPDKAQETQTHVEQNPEHHLQPEHFLSEDNSVESRNVHQTSYHEIFESEHNLQRSQPPINSGDLNIFNVDGQQKEYWSQEANEDVPQIPITINEDGYKQVLKENQYGVVSPLNLRQTYRTVVKEYKSRYRPQDLKQESPHESDKSDLEYSEDFIDEFFAPVKGVPVDEPVSEQIEGLDREDSSYTQKLLPKDENSHQDEETFLRKRSNVSQIDEAMNEIVDRCKDCISTQKSLPENENVREDEESFLRKASTVSQIDKEMNEIMERYLHTRASLLVKSVDNKNNKEENREETISLKKYSNFEDLQRIGNQELTTVDSATINPTIEFKSEYSDIGDLNDLPDNDNEPLTFQDLQFIEEMKAKYASTDSVSNESHKSAEQPNTGDDIAEDKNVLLRATKSRESLRPLSDINEQDLILIRNITKTITEKYEETPETTGLEGQVKVFEEKSEKELGAPQTTLHVKDLAGNEHEYSKSGNNDGLTENIPPLPTNLVPKMPVKSEIQFIEPRVDPKAEKHTSNIITVSEVIKENNENQTNKHDVRTIPESMIPKKRDDISHLPPSLRPKKPTDLPVFQSASSGVYSNVVFRNKQHRHSSQESHHSPVTSERPNSKRLSDNMFKETIFVPISNSPESPRMHNLKQDNTFKESIFVTSPVSTPSTSYVSKIPTWKKSLSTNQVTTSISQTSVTHSADNKKSTPGNSKYESFKEIIFVPKEAESLSYNESKLTRSEVKSPTTPQPEITSARSSWSDSLKKGLLDYSVTAYEPVYSNVPFASKAQGSTVKANNASKKPLPLPRVSSFSSKEYLTGSTAEAAKVTSRHDVFNNMTDSNTNFSEIVNDEEPKSKEANILRAPNLATEEPGKNALSQEVISVEESKAYTNILREHDNLPLKVTNLTKNIEPCTDSVQKDEEKISHPLISNNMSDPLSETEPPTPESSSEAANAVGTKAEEINITQTVRPPILDDDVEEIPRKPSDTEASNVNLFHMDSHSSYDSYLSLFKSKESKDFDDLRGKKQNPKGFFGLGGFAYVEEIVAEETTTISTGTFSFDEDIADSEVKPKIVDFVPLDSKTTPVFSKENTSYDTLEREKTFHVLETAAKISDSTSNAGADVKGEFEEIEKVESKPSTKSGINKSDLDCSLEVLARNSSGLSKLSSKSQTSTSRTSFSQAKKLFEALAEANKDERPKSAVTSTKPNIRFSVRDSKSLEHVKTSSSFNKEGINENIYSQKSMTQDEN